MVHLVIKASKAYKVQLVLKVLKEQQVHKELRVHPVIKASKEYKEYKE